MRSATNYPPRAGKRTIYRKDEAKMVAGIAIVMMLCHHFFGFPEQLVNGNHFTYLISTPWVNTAQFFASFGKLCVAIFAFCSGYALWISSKSFMDVKSIARRGLNFLVSYWIILAIFLIVGLIVGDELPDGETLAFNLLGLKTSTWSSYVNITFAWYVAFYISWLIVAPVTVRIFSATGRRLWLDALILLVWSFAFGYAGGKLPHAEFLGVFAPALVGVLFAKYRLFDNLHSRHAMKTWEAVAVIAALMVIRPALILLQVPMFPVFDGIIAGIFILACIVIVRNANSRKLEAALTFLGVYSMNMWFLHAMFFTGSRHLQTILYWPQYWLLVWVWGTLITLTAAIIVQRCWKVLRVKL